MGLDMYLTAERYISGYPFAPDAEREAFDRALDIAGLRAAADPETRSANISVTVAYWRKANAIHRWFVDNVQGGEDECRPHDVGRAALVELRDTCKAVLRSTRLVPGAVFAGRRMGDTGEWEDIVQQGTVLEDPSVAQELLPTQEGFFFGSTDYDEFYWRDLQDTVEQLDRVLQHTPTAASFSYRSSW